MRVPARLVGRIIDNGGAAVRDLQNNTGAAVRVPTCFLAMHHRARRRLVHLADDAVRQSLPAFATTCTVDILLPSYSVLHRNSPSRCGSPTSALASWFVIVAFNVRMVFFNVNVDNIHFAPIFAPILAPISFFFLLKQCIVFYFTDTRVPCPRNQIKRINYVCLKTCLFQNVMPLCIC